MSIPVRIAAAEPTVNCGIRVLTKEQTVEEHLYSQKLQNQVQRNQYYNNNCGGNLDYQQQILAYNQPSTSGMATADEAVAIDSCNDITMKQPMHTEWKSIQQQCIQRDVDMDEVRLGESVGAAGLEYQKHHQHANEQQSMDSNKQDADNGTGLGLMDSTTSINEEDLLVSTDALFQKLNEFDALQEKYHVVLELPNESRREVTAGGRDGSAYVLRCLKMWYELPSDVLFAAINLVDRFLKKMSVKPKHMACMSVASLYLAVQQLGYKPIPADDLVTISQCGCTARDLERMAGVIANKLGVQMGHAPITSLSFLRIYYGLFRNMAKELGSQLLEFYEKFIKLEELEMRLEVLICDVQTTEVKSSVLALVLICLHLDFHINESYPFKDGIELKHLFEYILYLQQLSKIPDRSFTYGFSIVSNLLSHYNGQNKQPYKQRLVWKLSSRTLRILRPIKRFSTDLTTIEEGYANIDDTLRSRSESVSSEEEEDWPTSPMIPIFEQC